MRTNFILNRSIIFQELTIDNNLKLPIIDHAYSLQQS